MVTDIEAFEETLTASGLPPVRGGRHDGREFRAGLVARDLGPLKVAAVENARLLSLATMAALESLADG